MFQGDKVLPHSRIYLIVQNMPGMINKNDATYKSFIETWLEMGGEWDYATDYHILD